MDFRGFVGPSYQLNSLNVSAQRSVNLYCENIESFESGNKYSLLGTPGISTYVTLAQTPIRGMWETQGRWFVVTYNKLYEILATGLSSEIGELSGGTSIVGMSDNGIELCIVLGERGFIMTLATNTITEITADGWRGSYTVGFLDGRFVFTEPDSARFYWSGLYDGGSIDALAFATAEGNPDGLVAAFCAYQEVYAFGTSSLEIYEDTGDANLPFQRIGGAVIEYGCAAAHSICKVDNAVMWLAKDARGSGMVYAVRGYTPQRISTHAVEQAIQGYSSISDATAYSYQENGHIFYVLNFTSANTTWVFDSSTNLWHERAYLNTSGILERHRGDFHVYAFGAHYVSDYESGKIYEMASTIFNDDGQVIKRIRITPHTNNEKKMLRYKKFEVNMESGVSNNNDLTPMASLSISKDGGHTYTEPRNTSIGIVGQYSNLVKWYQIGAGRDCVFKFEIVGKTKVNIVSAYLQVEVGAH